MKAIAVSDTQTEKETRIQGEREGRKIGERDFNLGEARGDGAAGEAASEGYFKLGSSVILFHLLLLFPGVLFLPLARLTLLI